MTIFEIPTLTTDRLRLRAFQASDLDAYASMQANPAVMRYLVTGRTSTRAEVWRNMAGYLGHWALRGYGMWACATAEGAFVGSRERLRALVGGRPLRRPHRHLAAGAELALHFAHLHGRTSVRSEK